MKDLGITGLPHLPNALPCTSIFSAGNAYTYYGTRSRYALSLDGHVSKALRKCTKSGVPIYCLIGTSVFLFLGFLNVSSSSAKVLTWLTSIVAAAQIIDYIVI
jgi:amino acid transporter